MTIEDFRAIVTTEANLVCSTLYYTSYGDCIAIKVPLAELTESLATYLAGLDESAPYLQTQVIVADTTQVYVLYYLTHERLRRLYKTKRY